jgi:ribonuclease HI
MVHRWQQLYKRWTETGGAAVVDDSGQTIWAEALPLDTSVQKAELIALIQALERAKGKKNNYFH